MEDVAVIKARCAGIGETLREIAECANKGMFFPEEHKNNTWAVLHDLLRLDLSPYLTQEETSSLTAQIADVAVALSGVSF